MRLDSIYKDRRGEILSITGGDLKYPEFAMFTTRKGMARGGCIHINNNEYFVVLQGTIIYYIGDKNKGISYKTGSGGLIPKNTPHFFYSLEDSIVIEWGATIEEKKHKHKEFRERVDGINAKQI